MLTEALEFIGHQLAHRGAGVPALLFSGGKESTLLLAMLLKLGVKLDCIVFHDEFAGQSRRLDFIEALAIKYDLHVVKWMPRARTVVSDEGSIDLLAEYSLNAKGSILILTSTYFDERECAIDWTKMPLANFDNSNYTLLFHGGRAMDEHSVFGSIPSRETFHGTTRIVYPLYHWSEEDVWAALADLEVEYDSDRYEDGDLRATIDYVGMCTNCLEPGVDKVFCPKRQERIDRFSFNWALHHEVLKKGLFKQ